MFMMLQKSIYTKIKFHGRFILPFFILIWDNIDFSILLCYTQLGKIIFRQGELMYKISVIPNEKIKNVSKSLYGLFFEDINRAGDGGLYAELLRNRAFEDGIIPKGCTYDKNNRLITSPTGWVSSFDCYEGEGIAGWENGNSNMTLISDDTLNISRKRALSVIFKGGYILNNGFCGVPLDKDKEYRFYFFAKARNNCNIKVALSSSEGEIYDSHIFALTDSYLKQECILKSNTTDFNGRLMIQSDYEGEVKIGFTSLFPTDTYKGRKNGLRQDLVNKLLD